MRAFNKILLIIFLSGQIAFANESTDSILTAINNDALFGKLDDAEKQAKILLEVQDDSLSYYTMRAQILIAKISGFKGDLSKMEESLKKIRFSKNNPDILFFYNSVFSQYCFLSQSVRLGAEYKESCIQDSKKSDNLRIIISGIFDELYLIYYTEDIENKLLDSSFIPKKVNELLDNLESHSHEMKLHEKYKLLQYRLFFCDPFNADQVGNTINDLLVFGKTHDAPNSLILGYLEQARYAREILNDTIKEMYSLKMALIESARTDNIRVKLKVNYEMMDYYFRSKQYHQAIKYGRKSIFPDSVDYSNYFDTYGLMARIYEEYGLIDSALLYKKIDYEKYKTVSAIHNRNMQTFFIDNLQENIKLKGERIERMNFNLILIWTLLISVLFIGLYILRTNKKLKKSNAELNRRNEIIENFSNILSHDLRAPIHSIGRLSSFILEEEKKLNENTIDSLNLIERTANNSTQLISNIMTYIRSKDDPDIDQEFSLKSIIYTSISNLNSLIKQEAAIINYSNLPDKIKGNQSLLELLFQNIIQNAIKAKSDKRISINIFYENGLVYDNIKLVDNGIGIRADKVEIFKKAFEQETFESVEKGIGLGLSISSHIMNCHHGVLSIESEYMEGTTIILSFPKGTIHL